MPQRNLCTGSKKGMLYSGRSRPQVSDQGDGDYSGNVPRHKESTFDRIEAGIATSEMTPMEKHRARENARRILSEKKSLSPFIRT